VCFIGKLREMSDLVRTRAIGDIGLVEMNRPERRNAMNTELLDHLVQSLLELKDESQVKATVTGFVKPTVAAIAGPCIGGGAELAAGCDLRVGTMSSAIRFPGASFGIPVGIARLPLLVGLSHAKDLLLTGRTVGAEEAFRIGFLNRVVDEAELEHEAVALASAMASAPGASQTKQLLDDASQLAARVSTENRALRRWQAGRTGIGA
jgi:enoyl-CoA hydratase/carnithine racemase